MSIRLGSEILAGTSSNDNLSITKNPYNKLQAVGVINQNDATQAIQTWIGTKAEYEELVENDQINANTIYNITDDSNDFQNILETMYPVGAIYIGTMEICPLSALFGTWEKVSSGRVLQGADEDHSAGETIEAGLPNITGTFGNTTRFSASDMASRTSGAFSFTNQNSPAQYGSNADVGGYVSFDASQSNSIYGNSNTVQPPAFVVNIWKRIA